MTSPPESDTPLVPSRTNFSLNLFSGLKGKGADGSLDVYSAVMIPMVSAMLADGRLDDAEFTHIEGICAQSPILDRNSSAENGALIMRAIKLVEDHGIEEMCRRSASLLSPALRETSFIFAVRITFSDGYVGKAEREVIEDMVSWLGIDADRARTMIDIVSVMNHPLSA